MIDVNDQSFLSPDSMIEAIQEYCRKHAHHMNLIIGLPGKLLNLPDRFAVAAGQIVISGLERDKSGSISYIIRN